MQFVKFEMAAALIQIQGSDKFSSLIIFEQLKDKWEEGKEKVMEKMFLKGYQEQLFHWRGDKIWLECQKGRTSFQLSHWENCVN